MHRLKNGYIPKIFTELIKNSKHKYPMAIENMKILAIWNIVFRFEDHSYGMHFCKTKKIKFNPTRFSKKL